MTTINKASAPTEGEAVYHIRLKEGDVPGYVLLPGAPERTLKIAEQWDDHVEVANYREYKTVRGTYEGVPIAATSTGIGCPSAEIAIHELNTLGAHTCIRVGTTGCIVADFDLGDLIIPVAAVRKDGTSNLYVEPEFPAFANPEVVSALAEACERLGYKYGYGLVYTAGSFYLGQGRPLSEDGYWPSWADDIIPDLQASNVTNIDMDTAGQYVVGYLHNMRMGAVLSVISNRVLDRWGDNGGEEKACRAASEAVKILMERDEKKKQRNG
ncbi:nucleoside phosphorylase [Bacillus sp. FJAT-50079]|uniref:nucleoside phosphorylase n=1 Tax=Bacillus sp. FJAT-50079 TaxID=2833577 RepID=UPI001BC99AD0|nr:nucleoside phosphorylase [Bacillus sp. FJAT-50079]MBS4208209.1 nucleoside phosphorylase [Bacillus sp. FJAT-50079]